jgi:hypothetical protein
MSKSLTFKTIEDVKRWCNEPKKHPIEGYDIPVMSKNYYDIYEKAYKIMKKGSFSEEYIINLFPKNHLLFGDVDLFYYTCCKKNDISTYNKYYKNNNTTEFIMHELLTEELDIFKDDYNGDEDDDEDKYEDKYEDDASIILKTEIKVLKNRFSYEYYKYDSTGPATNTEIIGSLITDYIEEMTDSFLDTDYISRYDYPERMKQIKLINLQGYCFINFLESKKMATGKTVLQYLIDNQGWHSVIYNTGREKEWIRDALSYYNDYKKIEKDIDECFNPYSGIIENYKFKKFTFINDPLDKYFEVYEKQLVEIKKSEYSQLIDLTTFKPKENVKYLNDEQYKAFKKERDKYDTALKKYRDKQTLYETTKEGSSPKPPKKPKITLHWGKEHTIAMEIDPLYIKDSIVAKFREEYAKVSHIVEEYNRVKNMSYKALKKHIGESSSSAETQLIDGNKLMSMTREDFANNILYNSSDFADKCSEKIDILTNEELDDENYPLSKLQLMVRMKVYTPDRRNYRTECIYAPKLYNYLIKCVNNKEPFINPVTKTKYTQENIDELMKVMKIIDPKIEVPVFIKHGNDTKLELKHKIVTVDMDDYGTHPSYGRISILKFICIYLSRVIGGEEKEVYKICNIPADVGATGYFATGSADLTSNTVLVNIYKLFNDGMLLHNYIPPYNIPRPGSNDEYIYIKPKIHFNDIKTIKSWFKFLNPDKTTTFITKEQFIDKFKHYAEEVKNCNF